MEDGTIERVVEGEVVPSGDKRCGIHKQSILGPKCYYGPDKSRRCPEEVICGFLAVVEGETVCELDCNSREEGPSYNCMEHFKLIMQGRVSCHYCGTKVSFYRVQALHPAAAKLLAENPVKELDS